jgi:hypothetical protein
MYTQGLPDLHGRSTAWASRALERDVLSLTPGVLQVYTCGLALLRPEGGER